MAPSTSDSTPAPSRPKAAYWVISLALAAALLYYSLRGIDWGQVWRILLHARWSIAAAALGLMGFSVLMRALRWRVLLGGESNVSVSLAFAATSAGYLGNALLPARAGEVVRTLMISRKTGMSKTFVLTTALSERVADAIVLVTISAVVLLALPQQPGWLAHAARPFAVLGLGGVAAIALLPLLEAFWLRLLESLPVPARLRTPIENALRHVLEGIRSFHDAGRLGRFLAFTAFIWFEDAVIAILSANAIHLAMSLPQAFLLIAGIGLGSALPSTPGYVGIYQFVAVSVLAPFGVSRSDAIAFIILYQALAYVAVLTLGSIALGRHRTARE